MSDVFPQRRALIVPIPGPAPATGAAFVQFTTFAPATWTSADLVVEQFSQLDIDFNVTVLSAGTAQLLIDRKEADGSYSNIATAVAKTAAATDVVSLGDGVPTSATLGTATGSSAWSVGVGFGDVIRIRVVVVTGNLNSDAECQGEAVVAAIQDNAGIFVGQTLEVELDGAMRAARALGTLRGIAFRQLSRVPGIEVSR